MSLSWHNEKRPVKQSVALVIWSRDDPSKVLLVQRPEDDDEFAGMWGLPAASCRSDETAEKAALRIGMQKLGTHLTLGAVIGSGSQNRPSYTIEMTLYKASIEASELQLPSQSGDEGVTIYTSWRWGAPSDSSSSARNGSLCSQLLLDSLGLSW